MRVIARHAHHAHVTHLLTCRRSFRRNARAERRRKEDEREERREDETAAKGAHFNGSGANKCHGEDYARARRARDARDTQNVRMTVRLRLRAREQASKRDSAAAGRCHARAWVTSGKGGGDDARDAR